MQVLSSLLFVALVSSASPASIPHTVEQEVTAWRLGPLDMVTLSGDMSDPHIAELVAISDQAVAMTRTRGAPSDEDALSHQPLLTMQMAPQPGVPNILVTLPIRNPGDLVSMSVFRPSGSVHLMLAGETAMQLSKVLRAMPAPADGEAERARALRCSEDADGKMNCTLHVSGSHSEAKDT